MELEHLCSAATEAIQLVLRHHIGDEVFHDDAQALIQNEIHELYPLRARAQDTSVADLEIACDAAVSVAEAFNEAHPDINLRWIYHCVQSLLVLELKPEALLDGQVERLPRKQEHQFSITSDSTSENWTSSSALPSPQLAPDTLDYTPVLSTHSSEGSNPVPMKIAKARWDEDETRRMVELKASGMCHREVAEILGRRQGSVENKYGRVMKIDEWKDHSTWYEASLRPKNKQGREDGCQAPLPKRQRCEDSP